METKDLILLLAIPIILVTLIFYLSNPSITGSAVSEQKQDNIIGTYSINPSFKAKFSYDLQDYTKIKNSLDEIIKCAQQGNDIKSCTASANSNDFEWSLGCDNAPEKVLYDLAEFYQNCFDSEDKDCVCSKNMDISKDEIMRYGLSKNEFRLAASQDIPAKNVNLKFVKPKIDLSYDVKLNGRSIWYPSLYIISYAEDKLIGVNMFFTDELSGERRALGPLKELALYKNEVNGIKSVDFVKQEGNSLIYPNNDIKKLSNIRACGLKPKNIYKFCATKKNFKIMAYDNDGLFKEMPLVVKFASYIPDNPPEPLKGLEAFEMPKAEKSVLAKWEKSSAKDLAKYKIYFTEQSGLLEKPTEELRKNPDVFVQEIDISAAPIVELDDSIIPNECEFDYQNKKCIFGTKSLAKTFIEDNKLYYSKTSNTYFYRLTVPEDKAYDFGATAVDRNGNEINNIDPKQKLPFIRGIKSIDDLPPDSSMQISANYDEQNKQVTFNLLAVSFKNIDDSKLEDKDFGGYKVYYKKYNNFNTIEEELAASSKLRDSKLNDLISTQIIDKNQNLVKIDISSENPQKDNVFFFVIISTDNNGNPKEEQFKVKELGAVPIKVIM